jgi:putative iron-only hydrogenase system regulator
MEKRLGFVGLIIEDREQNALSRTGIPCPHRKCSAITLVIDATTDQLGSLTGKLGRIAGVSVKSMLSKSASS